MKKRRSAEQIVGLLRQADDDYDIVQVFPDEFPVINIHTRLNAGNARIGHCLRPT